MEKQFSTFYLDKAHFGINILLIKEINRHLEITQVAGMPEFVRGLLNLRGQIVTVLDLKVKLGLEKQPISPTSRCIVLKTASDLKRFKKAGILDDDTGPDTVGLLVDGIGDMISVEQKIIDQPPANVSGVDGKYLAGVVQKKQGLMLILRINEVLS